MSNKIYFLVALMLTTFTLSSCLKDESDNKTTTYNDTAITAFSLGQLTQVRDTVTRMVGIVFIKRNSMQVRSSSILTRHKD